MATQQQPANPVIARGTIWTDEENLAIIKIWGEDKIQRELDGATRNPIYMKIAREMAQLGHNRDWEQCKTKIKKLKKDYKDVKDHNELTGRGRKTCRYFDELDEILGHRPISALLDSGSTQERADPTESGEEGEANGSNVP